MRISGQDPLLASIRRRRWRTCDRIAAGRSRAEVPALKARCAPAQCLSQKSQSTDTVTTAGTRETSGDLCVAGREQGMCASPVFSVTCCITGALTALSRLSLLCGEALCSHGTMAASHAAPLGHPSHQKFLPRSPPVLMVREHLYSHTREALPSLY